MTRDANPSREAEQQFGDHVREQGNRWNSELEKAGFDAVLVHAGSPMFSFLDDFEYAFRPNPHFLSWVPLTHHADSAILVRPGQKPVLCFFQPDDYWYLPPSDPAAWWAEHFDIRVVRGAEDWRTELAQEIPANTAAIGDSPSLTQVFADELINPQSLITGLHVQRTRKTPYEISCMAEAGRLAAMAHQAAETAFRSGNSEFGIHQAYLAASRHVDASLPYHNIVALNEHGAVLHYQGRDKQSPEDSRSFLIDAGCTHHAYCSDITRTYSREEGNFADLISAMDRLQRSLVDGVRAGVDFKQLHLDTHQGVAKILADSNLINISAEDAVESGLSAVFYPHGLGHFIGLQTHDVAGLHDNAGQAIPRPEGHPFLRLTRILEEGNALTIEPGLYFVEPLLSRWKSERDPGVINWEQVKAMAPYGGVRIEDNIVVGEYDNRNLTREAFASL